MLNYTAMAPDSWKRGLICCLLNIAQKLSSSTELFNVEVSKLRNLFLDNGYPVSYFNRVLEKFINKSSVTENTDLDQSSSEDVCILKIPFVGEASHAFSKKLKQIII